MINLSELADFCPLQQQLSSKLSMTSWPMMIDGSEFWASE